MEFLRQVEWPMILGASQVNADRLYFYIGISNKKLAG